MTIQVATELGVITCSECGIAFGMPQWYMQARRDDHKTFNCPNGHGQAFNGKSRAERLQVELEAARSLARRERERREAVQRSVSAYKGQLTRVKQRVGNGACPCCNRTFADLARHMKTKHPGYVTEDVVP